MAAALWAAHHFHLGTAATAVTAVLSLTPMYQAWASYRADREEAASAPELSQVADDLAAAVRRQWELEAGLRHLNDPYPMPVSWQAAPCDLVESWSRVEALARGWPGASADQSGWASGMHALAGTDGEIGTVFADRVPTRRLVVLGEPGSGKTMLLVRLLLDLAARRERAGGRGEVPVLFSLASWDPAREELFDWMVRRLALDYPDVCGPASLSGGQKRRRALLDRRLILPILDGFDELPYALRKAALDAINRALPLGMGLILTSRTGEYRCALAPASGLSSKLVGAAGIELLPLRPTDAAAYLLRGSGGSSEAVRRWQPVISQLDSSSPLAVALRRPLALFLASTIYNPRQGEVIGAIPDPSDLCDSHHSATPEAVEAHLFDAYIPAAYRKRPDASNRWTVEQAKHALAYLAGHLQHSQRGTPDLAWWQLATPAPCLPSGTGRIILGLAVAFPGVVLSLGLDDSLFAIVAAVIGVLMVLAIGPSRTVPADAMRWSWRWPRFAAGFGLGLALALAAAPSLTGLTGSGSTSETDNPVANGIHSLIDGDYTGLIGAIGFGLVVGLLSLLAAGGNAAAADPTLAASPRDLLARDRKTFLNLMALGTLIGTIFGALTFGLLGWSIHPLGLMLGVVAGLLFGLAFGVAFASARTSWARFTMTRLTLGLRGHLPRDLMGFLADAHERHGVLRQVGAVYQFRHVGLQRHLAHDSGGPIDRAQTGTEPAL